MYRNGNGHGVIHNNHTSKLPPLTFTYIHTHTLSHTRSLSWARALSLSLFFSLSFSLSLALSRSRALACALGLSHTHTHSYPQFAITFSMHDSGMCVGVCMRHTWLDRKGAIIRLYVGHDSVDGGEPNGKRRWTRARWLDHMCAMIYSYVWQDSVDGSEFNKKCRRTRAPWLNHVYAITYLCVWHNSLGDIEWIQRKLLSTHTHTHTHTQSHSGRHWVNPTEITDAHTTHDWIIYVPWLVYACDVTQWVAANPTENVDAHAPQQWVDGKKLQVQVCLYSQKGPIEMENARATQKSPIKIKKYTCK